jgi:hypothetical protein
VRVAKRFHPENDDASISSAPMEGESRRPGVTLDERTLRVVLLALGAFHVFLGGWQLFAADSFFEHVGRYGLENTHYVGDVGSFTLAFGIALLLAAGRPSWRAPILALGAIWYALHAFNHLFDIDENGISDARGVGDTLLLAIGAALLAWLASLAHRLADSRGTPGRGAQEGPRP